MGRALTERQAAASEKDCAYLIAVSVEKALRAAGWTTDSDGDQTEWGPRGKDLGLAEDAELVSAVRGAIAPFLTSDGKRLEQRTGGGDRRDPGAKHTRRRGAGDRRGAP